MSQQQSLRATKGRSFIGSLARATVLSLPVLLAACGGGGSDDSGATPVSITSANQAPVANNAFAVMNYASTSGVLAGGGPVILSARSANGLVSAAPSTLAALGQKYAALAHPSANQATGVTESQPITCENTDGNGTISASYASPDAVSAGDSLTVNVSNCQTSLLGGSAYVSGRLTLTFQTVSTATTYPYDNSIQVTADNITLVSGDASVSLNGDLMADMNQQSSSQSTVTLSGRALTVAVAQGANKRSMTLKDYTQTLTSNTPQLQLQSASAAQVAVLVLQNTLSNETNATVETQDSSVGSGLLSYQLTTEQPIVTDLSTGAFLSGSIVVQGYKSGLRLSVTGPDTFLLELDANGDGVYESSSNPTRTDLLTWPWSVPD